MKVLLIRLGAYGDAVMTTPLLRELKKDGHHVTCHISKAGHEVLKHSPNVDKFIIEQSDKKTIQDFKEYWEELGKNYDKVINLSGSIENTLLKTKGDKGYDWDHITRHIACDINYYEQTLRWGGYEGADPTPELHFTSLEHSLAKQFRRKYKNHFVILWSLSGSAQHKTWPFAEYVAMAMLKYSDVLILTVGDAMCQLIEWRHKRTKNLCGHWPIRKSMIMTKYADCVVGTETGILNASGAYDTPKVVILSHSSRENLSKHWKNGVSIMPKDLECYPCHKLIYNRNECPLDPVLKVPMCTTQVHSRPVFYEIEKIYGEWRSKR